MRRDSADLPTVVAGGDDVILVPEPGSIRNDLRTLGGFRGGGDQLLFGVFEKP